LQTDRILKVNGMRILDNGTSGSRAYIQIQVIGAAELYYGRYQGDVISGPNLQGMKIVASDGIQRFWWTGPLVVAVSADCDLVWDVEYFA
jgi:hypothetical protein